MKPEERSKREELTTYACLGLKRTLKSAGQRRRLLARGAQMILGTGQADQPEIMVRRDLYATVRREVLIEQLRAARVADLELSRETLLDCLRPRVELETYRRLLAGQRGSSRLDAAFQQHHDRRPTKAEQRLFQDHAPMTSHPTDPSGSQWRGDVLEQVLEAIEHQQKVSVGRLQTAWAELVGPEQAQQSSLQKVESGVAWFRCLNSALSYQLQRRPDLPGKLAQKLRLPIRQVRVAY